MSGNKSQDLIHVSEIDEYLASRILEENADQLSFRVEKSGEDGFITIERIELLKMPPDKPIDFELSPSEYLNLTEIELEDMLKVPIVTSSALELMDFLLLRTNGFSFTAVFNGRAWVMKITEPKTTV